MMPEKFSKLIRILFLSIFFSFEMKAQDVLILKNSAQLFVGTGDTLFVQGGVKTESGSSLVSQGVIMLNNNTTSNEANWTDEVSQALQNVIVWRLIMRV
jgi:hypothetical protein